MLPDGAVITSNLHSMLVVKSGDDRLLDPEFFWFPRKDSDILHPGKSMIDDDDDDE